VEGTQSGSVRIMTYNIHRWAGQDGRLDVARLARVIHAAGADVISLNEVIQPATQDERAFEPLAELADRLGMEFAFGPSGWVDAGPGWHGPVGNALLSRYPLIEVTNTLLPGPPGFKKRSLLEARMGAGPAAGLTAFVTHLDHAFEGTRMLQLRAVVRRMSREEPHYLAGDFNTPGFYGPNARRFLTPVLRMLHNAGYQDAFHVVGEGHGRTFPAPSPLLRIDFLFWPRRWVHGLVSVQTVNRGPVGYASDHRPVVAEWSWPTSLHTLSNPDSGA
jgi:endonuclease/exonuclease/phosphatase family metal-dependent hydrolase